MLAQIFILFALVSAVLSVRNLREEPAAAAVPVDHKRASAVFQSIMKKNDATAKSDASFIQKRTEAASSKRKMVAAPSNKETKVVTGPWNPMTDGYYIIRHRPNVDCTGVSSYLFARRIHTQCEPRNGGSFMAGCNHADAEGVVKEVFGTFASPDCSGEPYHVDEMGMGHCSFNVDNYAYWTPPDMRAVQCAPNGLQTVLHEGGVIRSVHESNDDTCEQPPFMFYAQKFGACELHMEFEDFNNPAAESTRYSYVSMIGCAPGGKVTMTAYSDAACTHPIWTGLAEPESPTFEGCARDNEWYVRSYCHAAPHHQ